MRDISPYPKLILPDHVLEPNVREWAKFYLDRFMGANEFDLYDFHQYFTHKKSGRCSDLVHPLAHRLFGLVANLIASNSYG